jgi:hypothetical protein
VKNLRIEESELNLTEAIEQEAAGLLVETLQGGWSLVDWIWQEQSANSKTQSLKVFTPPYLSRYRIASTKREASSKKPRQDRRWAQTRMQRLLSSPEILRWIGTWPAAADLRH